MMIPDARAPEETAFHLPPFHADPFAFQCDVARAGTGCGLGRPARMAGVEGAPSCGAAADVAAGAPLASFADTRLGVADGVPLGLGSVAGFGTSLRRSTRCRCNREQDYQGQMLHTR